MAHRPIASIRLSLLTLVLSATAATACSNNDQGGPTKPRNTLSSAAGAAGQTGDRTTAGTAGAAGATGAAGTGAAIVEPKLPLRTQTRYIVDNEGTRFKLASVNWYGAESATLVPDGLAINRRTNIARLIREMGFNSVRIPFCNQLVATDPVVDDTLIAANMDLSGKHALEVLDAVIEALAAEGIVVILDNHRSRGDWCCDTIHGDGLWYTEEYPEETFIAHWETMTRRYLSQPFVVGMDLRNELRGQLAPGVPTTCTDCNTPTEDCVCEWASWGDSTGIYRDWPAAATRTGNSILAINPSLLIVVEGPHWATWLGANYLPIALSVANRLVYSAHNYAMNGGFDGDCPAYKAKLESQWGYVVTPDQRYTAPLWLGEFGVARNATGIAWWACIREYLVEKDLDWAYWPLNGTQGPGYGRTAGSIEGYGILNVTWDAPAEATHIAQLQALQAPTLP